MNKKLIYSLIVFLSIACSCNLAKNDQDINYLIVISLDGYRWDYNDLYDTPVFDSLKKVGVVAESLKPSFPTKTFPNHYTIATGLYPDHHGLVGNYFHDTDLGEVYRLKDRATVEDGRFYGGEPIWVTAVNQKLRTATIFWVGSEAEIKGVRPTYWKRYNHDMPLQDRFDTIISWLELAENKRPRLIMGYYHEPDWTGHEYGPYSNETKELIESLDEQLGDFFSELRKLPFFNRLNIIITSDHGMGELSNDRKIIFDKAIDTADIEFYDGLNPNLNIKVKAGKLDKVYRDLKNTPHLFVWKHDSLPSRLNYGTHPRTHDLCVVAYPGWAITSSRNNNTGAATHGFDNDYKDMHAIFYAVGPAFKKDFVHPTFENVDIYPLMAKVLGIVPAETDGNIDNVSSMLGEN